MPTSIRPRSRYAKAAKADLALCVALLMLLGVAATITQAQSGRGGAGRKRPAESKPPESPTSESGSESSSDSSSDSTPTQTQTASNTRPRPDYTFIVSRYVQSPNIMVETTLAFNSFIERLRRSPAVEVIPVPTDMTRKEAIERAKQKEQNAYVVWLRVDVDTPDTERAIAGAPINPSCLLISYTVFSPQTAKVKAQGKVYMRGYAPDKCMATMGSPIPRREPVHLPNDYRMRVAGSDTAERVLKAFDLN